MTFRGKKKVNLATILLSGTDNWYVSLPVYSKENVSQLGICVFTFPCCIPRFTNNSSKTYKTQPRLSAQLLTIFPILYISYHVTHLFCNCKKFVSLNFHHLFIFFTTPILSDNHLPVLCIYISVSLLLCSFICFTFRSHV